MITEDTVNNEQWVCLECDWKGLFKDAEHDACTDSGYWVAETYCPVCGSENMEED